MGGEARLGAAHERVAKDEAVPCSGTGTEGEVFLQLGSTFTVSPSSKTELLFDVREGTMSSRARPTGSTDRTGVGVMVGFEVTVRVGVFVGVAGVGVRVGVDVFVGVSVGVGAPAVTSTHAENSDVLFCGSVAVAVRNWPTGATPERAV
jgi:hypothetical protein